jgi:hypothetical protein
MCLPSFHALPPFAVNNTSLLLCRYPLSCCAGCCVHEIHVFAVIPIWKQIPMLLSDKNGALSFMLCFPVPRHHLLLHSLISPILSIMPPKKNQAKSRQPVGGLQPSSALPGKSNQPKNPISNFEIQKSNIQNQCHQMHPVPALLNCLIDCFYLF